MGDIKVVAHNYVYTQKMCRCDGKQSRVTSCTLVHSYTKFQRNVLSKSLGHSEGGGSRFLQNADTYVTNYTASYLSDGCENSKPHIHLPHSARYKSCNWNGAVQQSKYIFLHFIYSFLMLWNILVVFMFAPCINSIKALFVNPTDAHNYKITGMLKQLKFPQLLRHVSVHSGTIIREPLRAWLKLQLWFYCARR